MTDPTPAPVAQPALTDEERDDGPECETCGKVECPDAALPSFSEPRDCAYAPIYHALKDAKDCGYGCARDYTNQAVRLWVVEAVERILAARDADLRERLADPALVEAVLREHAWGDDTAQVGHHAVYCACGWKDYEASGDIYALRARHDQHRATVVAAALSGEAGR